MQLFGTVRFHLKGLTDEELNTLTKLSYDCRKLYNAAIIFLEEYFKASKRCGTAAWLGEIITNAPEFIGQGYIPVLKQASTDFYRAKKTGKKLPKASNRPGAIFCRPIVSGRYITIPLSKHTDKVVIQLSDYIIGKQVVAVALRPVYGNFQHWEIEITYIKFATRPLSGSNFVGIDFGFENFATLACSNGSTLIIDGRRLKSILRLDYQKQKQKQEGYGSSEQIKRTHQIDDYLNKSVQVVLQFCIENEVGTVAIGTGMINSKLRKSGVKNFWPHFPFGRFQAKLAAKLQQQSIQLKMIDESYTSQASFLDGDFVPFHISRSPVSFSGKRIKRGLYQSAKGVLINADVNGGYNILAKFSLCDLSHLRENPKLIKSPQRIDPLNCKPKG